MEKNFVKSRKMVKTKCSLKSILIIIIIFGIVVPLFIQITLLLHQTPNYLKEDECLALRAVLNEDLDVKRAKIDNLKDHLKELNDIQLKTLVFLNQLDRKRETLSKEITVNENRRDKLLHEIKERNRELKKVRMLNDFRSRIVTNIMYVGLPKNYPLSSSKAQTVKLAKDCNYNKCFDYSRCSSIKEFKFFLNNIDHPLYKVLRNETELTTDSKKCCISFHYFKLSSANDDPTFSQKLNQSNPNEIILVEPDAKQNIKAFCDIVYQKDPGAAILILPWVCKGFRTGFDYILPPDIPLQQDYIWKITPPLVPLARRHLLSFNFVYRPLHKNTREEYLSNELKQLADGKDILIKTNCQVSQQTCTAGWCVCSGSSKLFQSSKFSIVPVYRTNAMLFSNLIDILKAGCVPVLIGDMDLLPFSNTIDWKAAAITLPSQRLPELLFTLRSLPSEDLIALKKQGRFLFEIYFSSRYTIFRTMISNLQANIGLPPTPYQDVKAVRIKIFNDSNKASTALGMRHNMSYAGPKRHQKWNNFPGALRMVPIDPWVLPPPPEYQFLDEGKDFFTPIGNGKGGNGEAFSRSLGGDHAMEMFTVLMLTYDRPTILMEALQRLSGMKYLHKIVVVWNHPIDPHASWTWPDVGVEVEIIRTGRNSLNNRFIPYDVIETEAILSMDDDIYLRHDEIELAFRIWRENRDRLVGFPGRYHSFNETSNYFYYSSQKSCELSLVLTGGAFFNKYYSYLYTNVMEKSIKDMVDRYMNCEDIAMNYLVSHVTQKPPIKVTSRWTFRCSGCPVALSSDADHYEERSVCMKYLQQVYGYTPLKRTQFRADSVLFKTRMSSTASKCFQYV